MQAYATLGVSMVGGCCGTTPEYIARLRAKCSAPLAPAQKVPLRRSCLCTPVRFVEVDGITVVGERINPTGKKRLQQALREGGQRVPLHPGGGAGRGRGAGPRCQRGTARN